MQPHVFVVMPFGVKEAPGATPATDGEPEILAINVSFDDVYDLLIGPALAKSGCVVPFRADNRPHVNAVNTQSIQTAADRFRPGEPRPR